MIVGIIVLLIGILMPALNKYYMSSLEAKSQAIIHLIDGACGQYRTDFDDYPPSRDNTNHNGWYGSELIVLFLTGYGPDPNGNGIMDGTLATDDGHDSYGFRLIPRGKVYNYGLEKLDTASTSGSRTEFTNVFNNRILYYRYDGTNYISSHNTGGPSSLDSTYAKNAEGTYFRRDYMLISQGLNEEWDPPHDIDSDDITNFFVSD